MQIGTSGLIVVEDHARERLAFGSDYIRIKIVDTQLFYPVGVFVSPGRALVSTAVSATDAEGKEYVVRSLHTVAQVARRTPIRTGLQPNLTGWLPARARDAVKVAVSYSVLRDPAFGTLLDQAGKLGLVNELSLLNPQLAVALRVTEIVGRLLDFLNRAGSEDQLLEMNVDLNMAELEAGHYAVLGSLERQEWPRHPLRLGADGRFDDASASRLEQLSYVLLRVLRLPTQAGDEYPNEAWWQALQAALDAVRDAVPAAEPEKMLAEWHTSLRQVRALGRNARGFHLAEIQARIQAAQREVLDLLRLGTAPQSAIRTGERLPAELRELFGVETEEDLSEAVRDYHDARAATRLLLKRYGPDGE